MKLRPEIYLLRNLSILCYNILWINDVVVVLYYMQGLAIISRQCEDRVTGRTYIAHAQDMIKHEMCPYDVTPFDQAEEHVVHGRR